MVKTYYFIFIFIFSWTILDNVKSGGKIRIQIDRRRRRILQRNNERRLEQICYCFHSVLRYHLSSNCLVILRILGLSFFLAFNIGGKIQTAKFIKAFYRFPSVSYTLVINLLKCCVIIFFKLSCHSTNFRLVIFLNVKYWRENSNSYIHPGFL